MIDELANDDFDSMFREWYGLLVYFAFLYTHDKEVARDIVVDSFVKLWERREAFNNTRVMIVWLYSTVRNACLNWLRHQQYERQYARDQYRLHEPQELSLFDEVIRAEFIQQVMASMSKLPPQCRKIFEMLYIEGKTPKETARELQLSISAISHHKANGLALLRKMLANMLGVVVLFLC
jgi:RNA polymerase sigma-70 factor (family 1)